MDEAVTEQHYAEAERYRVRLSELAEEKALAIEKDQHASAYDATGKVGFSPVWRFSSRTW